MLRILCLILALAVPVSASASGTVLINPLNGHSYLLVGGLMSWAQAEQQAAARTENGQRCYLATLTSPAETAWVTANLLGSVNQAWIGLYQGPNAPHPDADWRWVTGEGFGGYTNWGPGEPGDGGNDPDIGFEDCGTVNKSGEWNDLYCTAEVPAVVECGAFPVSTAPAASDLGLMALALALAAAGSRSVARARYRSR